MGWWDDVLGEEFLRGNGKLPGHNPPGKYNFWGTTIGGLSYYIGFYFRIESDQGVTRVLLLLHRYTSWVL